MKVRIHDYGAAAARGACFICCAVFVTLLVFIIAGTAKITRAADGVLAAVDSSQRYETLERNLWIEASIVRVHGLDAQGSGWYEERAAAIETENTLTALTNSRISADRAIATDTSVDHDRYMDVLLVLFSQIDNRDPLAPKTYQQSSRIFEHMQQRIDERASAKHEEAKSALRDLARTQSATVQMIIFASLSAFILFGICIFVILSYRNTIERVRREELAHLDARSLTDNLTGLGNHRAYQEALAKELARLARHDGVLSLAVIDIDGFKGINDRMGHVHGDRVLAALGELLRKLRKTDASFRLGGDEFGVILPYTPLDEAALAMDRLCKEAPTVLFGSTISVGVTSIDCATAVDATSLRGQADGALYVAKQSGRNTVITYADAQKNGLMLSPDKERAVQKILDSGTIDVEFQPIWDVGCATPIGFEALVRPALELGLDGPGQAFDVAERIGKATELDLVCVRAALTRAKELPPNSLLFINIVPETLSRGQISGAKLAGLAADAGIVPQRIVVEVTERVMLHVDVLVDAAKALQAHGFKLALDDTGAGNAGLEVLRCLAVDYVKIDRLVLMQAMSDPISRAIVASIVAIARAMGAYIIAEGIETTEALEFVYHNVMQAGPLQTKSFAVQGYLLGRPSHAPWTEPAIVRASDLLEHEISGNSPVALAGF